LVNSLIDVWWNAYSTNPSKWFETAGIFSFPVRLFILYIYISNFIMSTRSCSNFDWVHAMVCLTDCN
jgi:hypothetical protein